MYRVLEAPGYFAVSMILCGFEMAKGGLTAVKMEVVTDLMMEVISRVLTAAFEAIR